MDFTPLCDELKKPEYQDKTDQEAADLINAKTEVIRKPVDCGALKAYAIKQGFYAVIEENCTSSDVGKRHLCLNIKAWIDDIGNRLMTVNMDDPVTMDMMVGLVAYDIVDAVDADAMSVMGSVTMKWVDLNGYGELGIGLVQAARRING